MGPALAVVLEAAAAGLAGFGIVLARRRPRVDPAIAELGRFLVVRSPTEGAPFGAADIDGRITSPPNLTAPLSGTPCAVWEVAVCAEHDELTFSPIWAIGRAGDVTLAYDHRMLDTPRAHVVPGSAGSVDVPGERIRVIDPTGSGRVMPWLTFKGDTIGEAGIDSAVLDRLGAVGLPPDLARQVRDSPERYRVREGVATTGDPLRLGQVPAAPPRRVPDPDQDFAVLPLSRRAIPDAGNAAGCLSSLLIMAGVLLALCGAGLFFTR